MSKKSIILFFVLLIILPSCTVWHQFKRFIGIEKSSIEANYSPNEIDRIIRKGLTFKGVPYKSGGIDERGLDCSGLLFLVYSTEGYEIPRLSKDQSNFGLPVSLNEIQVGDWIFFRTNNSKEVNHAGLVTNSKGGFDVEFLHASTSKGVRVDKLTNAYWSKALFKIIRPFKN